MRIGIDLGGTKIEIIVLDDDGYIRHRKRSSTPVGDYDGIVRSVCALVENAENTVKLPLKSGPLPVGIGIPGTISPSTGLVKNANSTCLIGKPLDQDLEQVLGQRVRLANDADCFVLSEAIDGAAADDLVVFGVILGTGVGGGLVINKQLVRGPNFITGEWGHNPLPWPSVAELNGIRCYCGRVGCIETFLSGPALVRDASEAGGRWSAAEEVTAAADSEDPMARAILQRYCERLARSLASIINILDPDRIVLGGGLSNIHDLYKYVPALWDQYVFSDTVVTKLSPPLYGDSGGARGAAWLWPLKKAAESATRWTFLGPP